MPEGFYPASSYFVFACKVNKREKSGRSPTETLGDDILFYNAPVKL